MNEQDRGNGNGRAPSVPPSSSPPSSSMPPSMPPSTDEIDSDWASEPDAAPEPPPPPPPPPAEVAPAKVVHKVPMHKATLIGIAAVVPPAGFDLRREPPAAAKEPALPPSEAPPPPPAQQAGPEGPELSLNEKLSSVPPPPAPASGPPPASKPPLSQPAPSAHIDATQDVDDVKFARGGSSVWPWLAVAAIALLAIGYWTVGRPSQKAETLQPPAPVAKPAPTPLPMPDPPYEVLPAPTMSAAAATTSSAEPSSAPSAMPSSEAPPAAAGATVVIVTAKPADARFFLKGKEVGTSPLRVELAPGEKRSYEVGMKGYGTRKVVIDGSKPEVLVGLKPTTTP